MWKYWIRSFQKISGSLVGLQFLENFMRGTRMNPTYLCSCKYNTETWLYVLIIFPYDKKVKNLRRLRGYIKIMILETKQLWLFSCKHLFILDSYVDAISSSKKMNTSGWILIFIFFNITDSQVWNRILFLLLTV